MSKEITLSDLLNVKRLLNEQSPPPKEIQETIIEQIPYLHEQGNPCYVGVNTLSHWAWY